MYTYTNQSNLHFQMWQEAQLERVCPSSTNLLHNARLAGWRLSHVELVPSWDQYGFVYLVTIRGVLPGQWQRLVLPKNNQVEQLLDSFNPAFSSRHVLQPVA